MSVATNFSHELVYYALFKHICEMTYEFLKWKAVAVKIFWSKSEENRISIDNNDNKYTQFRNK